MPLLDNFDAHLYAAQNAPDRDAQLTRLTIAVEALGNVVRVLDARLNALEAAAPAVAALEARVAHLERTRPAEVDPLRLLDLSEAARRLGFARATITKLRPQLPIIDLPSGGKGTLPFVREADLLDWLEAHKRKATL